MTAIPRLLSLATAVPGNVLHQDEVAQGAAELFAGSYANFARLAPVYENAQIDTRYSCVPLEWYQQDHGFAERNRLYIENAVELLERAAVVAIERAGLGLADVDGLVVVSSTGVATPSLDALLMERLGLRRDLRRLPIFGLGCAGGVIGLARAGALARAEPETRVLLLVVELCGLTFRSGDRSKSNIVATALFGDGAVAALVSCQGEGPALAAWGEHTWPDSLGIMGWEVKDDGLAVVFSRHIPTLVRQRMGAATTDFLAAHGLALEDVDAFVCHPGGAKVVEALEEVYGLEPGALVHTREILREYGNMSAPTVLFVLERTLAEASSRRQLLTALGPGFTAGFLILER